MSPSSGDTPGPPASRRTGGPPFSALTGGDPRTSQRSSPRTGTPATSHRSPGVSAKLARRTAALRLVQIIAGGSLAGAAKFLGISSGYGPWRRSGGRVYSPAGLADSLARQLPDPLSFETGLRSLTRELSHPGTPLVNYQRRRQALQAWSINEDAWPKLAARRTLMARPESGDRKRQIASVYVWVRITSGERCFAPRPIDGGRPSKPERGNG
jgi:hypothetical protein